MLEAAQQVLQIVRDLTWRFFNLPGDLGDAHRIAEQQINEVFAEHNLLTTISRETTRLPPGRA